MSQDKYDVISQWYTLFPLIVGINNIYDVVSKCNKLFPLFVGINNIYDVNKV